MGFAHITPNGGSYATVLMDPVEELTREQQLVSQAQIHSDTRALDADAPNHLRRKVLRNRVGYRLTVKWQLPVHGTDGLDRRGRPFRLGSNPCGIANNHDRSGAVPRWDWLL